MKRTIVTGTNNKGIENAIAKAEKRAEWYKMNYCYVKDLQKKLTNQFITTLRKFVRCHKFTDEQKTFFMSKVPLQYMSDAKNLLAYYEKYTQSKL
jgi:hypothetical protein